MSTAIPFWNYFWHIFGLVCILLICLPTGYWRKINKRFALHRELPMDDVQSIRYGVHDIPSDVGRTLIEAYNKGNFLYRKSPYTAPGTPALTWIDTTRNHTYAVYPNTPYIDVVQSKGRKTVVFTLQCPAIHDWLLEQQRSL